MLNSKPNCSKVGSNRQYNIFKRLAQKIQQMKKASSFVRLPASTGKLTNPMLSSKDLRLSFEGSSLINCILKIGFTNTFFQICKAVVVNLFCTCLST